MDDVKVIENGTEYTVSEFNQRVEEWLHSADSVENSTGLSYEILAGDRTYEIRQRPDIVAGDNMTDYLQNANMHYGAYSAKIKEIEGELVSAVRKNDERETARLFYLLETLQRRKSGIAYCLPVDDLDTLCDLVG